MSPDEAQAGAPRRRGRPPGSKNKTTRRRGAGGGDLVGQLNSLVAELIKKNRQLQRQVANLTSRAEKSAAGRGVERGIRTLQKRVKKALGGTTRRRRKAASTVGRKRKTTATRRRKSA